MQACWQPARNRMTDNPKGYRHPELLVTPQALSAALAGGATPLLLDLRPAEQYAAGHLPGAVHLDIWGISLIDTDPAPLKSFLWVIEHLFAERGVSAERPVVVLRRDLRNTRRAGVLVSRVLRTPGRPRARRRRPRLDRRRVAAVAATRRAHADDVEGQSTCGAAGDVEGRARSHRRRRRGHSRHEVGRRVFRHAGARGARRRDSRCGSPRMDTEPRSRRRVQAGRRPAVRCSSRPA